MKMSKAEVAIHIISILIVIAGGILSLGDKWFAMDSVPPWLVHSWQIALVGATLVDRIGKLVLNYIQTNLTPLQQSAAILAATKVIAIGCLTFFFCSCTTTTTKNVDGSTITTSTADAKVVNALEIDATQVGQAAAQAAINNLNKQLNK